MRREELTARFAAYERLHDVTAYEVHGVRIWPLMRVVLGLRLHAGVTNDGAEAADDAEGGPGLPGPSRWTRARAVGRFARQAVEHGVTDTARRIGLGPLVAARPPSPTPGRREVVLMSNANRAIPLGGGWYNPVVDPLAEWIAARGLAPVIWESGPGSPQRASGPVPYMDRLASQCWLAHLGGALPRGWPEPHWFAALAAWAADALGLRLIWAELQRIVRDTLLRSAVLERWLRRVGCRLLLLDCWYSAPNLAASLAASRLGIPRVDVQHGLQGAGHFAYASWAQAPEGGYALVPDRFWVWGSDARDDLVANNPRFIGSEQVVVGGNPWINRWRGGDAPAFAAPLREARSLARGPAKTVLVTVQKTVDYESSLLARMAESPREWLWLIRFRQDMRARMPALEARLRGAGLTNHNLRDATRLPLYALMRAASVHVTWYSTCALEALAFGLPTVLLHPSGREAFGTFVDRGAMVLLAEGERIEPAVQACAGLEPRRLVDAAAGVFAPAEATDAALAALLFP